MNKGKDGVVIRLIMYTTPLSFYAEKGKRRKGMATKNKELPEETEQKKAINPESIEEHETKKESNIEPSQEYETKKGRNMKTPEETGRKETETTQMEVSQKKRSKLEERYKKEIRELVRQDCHSPNDYSTIYKIIMRTNTEETFYAQMLAVFARERGSRLYEAILPVYGKIFLLSDNTCHRMLLYIEYSVRHKAL